MDNKIIENWENRKHKLKEWFETNETPSSYKEIFEKIIELIITEDERNKFNLEKIRVIDDGDYQGTQIFIAFLDVYQPSVEEYIMTSVYYGSCSGCDTLQSIRYASDEDRVNDLMTLSLHMIQKMKWM